MTKLDGRLALIGALAVVAAWPTWIPYERSVLMWLKFLLWRHFVLLSVLAFAWILVRVYHEWNVLHRQRALLATAALLVLLGAYLQLFLVYMQYVGDESVLRQCVAYCPSPFEDCLRVRDPARELVTSDVAQGFLLPHVFGNATEGIADAIMSREEGGDVVLYKQGSSDEVRVSRGARSILLGIHASRLFREDFDAFAHVPSDWIPPRPFVHNAAVAYNAVQRELKSRIENVSISILGDSINGKVAFLAAMTSDEPYDRAIIDAGGALVASAQLVGPCGETIDAVLGRNPSWIAAQVPDESTWPVDIGDLTSNCRTTRLTLTTSTMDWWNNPKGTQRTVERARRYGCDVDFFMAETAHGPILHARG